MLNKIPTPALFLIPAVIWGSTWIGIKFQLGVSGPEFSVFLRFLVASFLSIVLCWALGIKLTGYSRRVHLLFIVQGLATFSLNYILTYHAERFLASGIVAVTFTILIFLNMLGLRVFFGRRTSQKVIVGATVGAFGIILLFWSEIQKTQFDQVTLWGLVIGILATFSASAGNLIAVPIRQTRIDVLASNAWGMLYGTIWTFGLFLFLDGQWLWDPRPQYWIALAYLAVFGTVVAFATYMQLLERIGPDRSAYITVVSPVFALAISTVFEGYKWDLLGGIGIALALLGNVLILRSGPAVALIEGPVPVEVAKGEFA